MATGLATLFPGESPVVLGLDAVATLALLGEQRRVQDEAAARELKVVTHWADLHRVDRTIGSVDHVFDDLGGQPVEGREGLLRLAGQGAFAVEEFAVTEVATVLGMSEPAARAYVGQALELRDRLPRLWSRVMSGVLPAWKARQVAAETIPLNPAAAAYVDAHLAPFAEKVSLRRILRAVHAAVIRHDPALAAQRAAKAAEHRGVGVSDEVDGTSRVDAILDTPDAAAFDAALDELASTLAALGDAEPAQVRRARAVGVLADPQYALDLTATLEALGADPGAGPVDRRPRRAGTSGHGPVFHVHLHTDAVTAHGVGAGQVARVDRFGPRVIETVEAWLRGLAPGATVKLTPVIDTGGSISVDAYEIPDRLRDQVSERDDCCRFPWCGRKGAFDLDHIEAYLDGHDVGDPEGRLPPGQTSSENLARLCHYHHRVKTHSAWSYHREPDGSLTWSSPHGRSYRVDNSGTTPLG